MKLEDVTADNVREVEDDDLLNLRERANQLHHTATAWERHLRKRVVGVNQPIPRNELMVAYEAIREEIRTRGLDAGRKPTALDRKILRKAVRGFDVSDLPPVVVSEGVVCLDGAMVSNPRRAEVASIRIDGQQFGDPVFTAALEKRVVSHFLDQVDKPAVVRRDNDGLTSPILPLYDLVLVPRVSGDGQITADDLGKRLGAPQTAETAETDPEGDEAADGPRIGLSGGSGGAEAGLLTFEDVTKYRKPAHVAQMVPLGPQFGTYDTKADHFGDGIAATYGLTKIEGKSVLVAVRFDATRFTAEAAEDWLRGGGYWTDEATLKPAGGGTVTKKARREPDGVPFLKNEEQRIVGGVVYYLDEIDAQGDFMDSYDEMHAAMRSWMVGGHVMKVMHRGYPVETPLIECFLAEGLCKKGGHTLQKGDWYISNYIPDDADELWQSIKAGEITGYSMGGRASAVDEVS